MNNYLIDINIYKSEDLILKDQGVIFVSDDVGSRLCRITPRPIRHIYFASCIALKYDHVYIPRDLCPEDHDKHIFQKPIRSINMSKYRWKRFKENYSYKRRDYV